MKIKNKNQNWEIAVLHEYFVYEYRLLIVNMTPYCGCIDPYFQWQMHLR